MENQQLIESLDRTVANLRATNEAGFRDKAKEVYGKAKAGVGAAAGKVKSGAGKAWGATKAAAGKAGSAIKSGAGKVKDAAVKGGKYAAGKWNALPKKGKIGVGLAAAGAVGGAAALAARRRKAKHESLTEDFDMSRFSN